MCRQEGEPSPTTPSFRRWSARQAAGLLRRTVRCASAQVIVSRITCQRSRGSQFRSRLTCSAANNSAGGPFMSGPVLWVKSASPRGAVAGLRGRESIATTYFHHRRSSAQLTPDPNIIHSPATSPPARVASARQADSDIVSETNRTLPSHTSTCTPPGCLLRAVESPLLCEPLPQSHVLGLGV